MARIELVLRVAAPASRCFDLARSVDAHVATASSSGERVIGGRTSGLLEEGEEVTWRARHVGVWQELTSRITAFDRPSHFRDSLVRGAFARFDHDHYFETVDGGTVLRDVFDYRAPLGPLGWLAERLFLTGYMRRFLEARMQGIKVLAESDRWRQFVPPAA